MEGIVGLELVIASMLTEVLRLVSSFLFVADPLPLILAELCCRLFIALVLDISEGAMVGVTSGTMDEASTCFDDSVLIASILSVFAVIADASAASNELVLVLTDVGRVS